MKKNGYYSSGEFARKARITQRTVRYYDKKNILKPSLVNESGARFYTDSDFARLQQILLLKYLGFSLDEIKEITVSDADPYYLINSLNIQLTLVKDKIEQMQSVEKAIEDTTHILENNQNVDWNNMLNLIHLTVMEKSMSNQYRNASNIISRINLHQLYSQNQQGWFPWIYEYCAIDEIPAPANVLEIGCGDGTFWAENYDRIPKNIHIILSDVSEGMLRDAKRKTDSNDSRFSFENFNCEQIPYEDEKFDLIIANHLLFYCEDIPNVCKEIHRLLTAKGRFLCSTYSSRHMMEILQIVKEFDDRIILSADKLYDKFGLENGSAILEKYFSDVEIFNYEDELIVPEADSLISYILSCHGNQNQYIINRYKEFHSFVTKKTKNGFHITKDAGIFICKK